MSNVANAWPPTLASDLACVKQALSQPLGMRQFASRFEREWSVRFHRANVLMTNNGSAALELAVSLLDLLPGDEVIVPAYTYAGTVMPVLRAGGVPIFCDTESHGINMDVSLISDLVTPRTKAIIVSHLNGVPVDMSAVLRIAKERKLRVIEDCCQACGALYKGKSVGTFGDIAAFSFNDSKQLPAQEGGLVMTKKRKHFLVLRKRFNSGKESEVAGAESVLTGWKFRPTEVSAALALNRIKYLRRWNKQRFINYTYLEKKLATLSGVSVQKISSQSIPSFWKFPFFISEEIAPLAADVQRIITSLEQKKIRCFQWQKMPLPFQKAFSGYRTYQRSSFMNAMDIAVRTVWLDDAILPYRNTTFLDTLAEDIKKVLRVE